MDALTVLTVEPTSAPGELAARTEKDDVVATLRVTRDGGVVIFAGIDLRPDAPVDELVTALAGYAADADAISVRVNDGQAELTTALAAYPIVSRNMYHPMDDPGAQAPPGAGYRAMTAAEYEPWREANIANYAEEAYLERLDGDVTEARRLAAASYAELLPDGLQTANTSLVVLTASGERVGTLWLTHRATRFPHIADRLTFIYGIDIDAGRRGEGWGKAGLAISDELCLAAGDPGVGLNVFADNMVANGLYGASGFRVVQQTFDLRLPAAG